MIEAVREYLALVTGDALPEEIRLRKLAKALDRLVCAHHEAAETMPDLTTTLEPLPGDYKSLRQAAQRAFPDLGFYPWSDPRGKIGEDPLVGDALDDIADIARDLAEVAWRWENVSPADAGWHFRLLYQTHWGAHAHALRSYVYGRIWR